MTQDTTRVPMLAVVGNAGRLEQAHQEQAEAIGRLAMEAGFRIVTGGLDGVMEAASKGARTSPAWREGRVLGIIPSYDRAQANPWLDVVIASGAQLMRNVLVVASADCVAVVGGGTGTLSEIALAWQLGKPVLALASAGGWGQRLAGERLDHRRQDQVERFESPEALIERAAALCAQARPEAGEIGTGWKRREA